MNFETIRILGIALSLAVTCFNWPAAEAQSFSLKISTPEAVIRVGDQVLIHVVVMNKNDHDIPMPAISLDTACDYRIEVDGGKGGPMTVRRRPCN